jgi:DNA-binding transcriptional regulator YhcF (GntR family)
MVKQHVVNLLTQGVVGFGEKLPSEHSLMEQFNVSRNTIRQAFAELTSLGLIYKEQGRGTFSKYVPKNRNEKRIVAVMTTYISDYIFPDIIFGIEEVLSAEGYSMLLSNTNNNKEKETQFLRNIIAHDVCGLIIEPTRSALANINQPLFDEMREKGIQIVFINAAYPDIPVPAFSWMMNAAVTSPPNTCSSWGISGSQEFSKKTISRASSGAKGISKHLTSTRSKQIHPCSWNMKRPIRLCNPICWPKPSCANPVARPPFSATTTRLPAW